MRIPVSYYPSLHLLKGSLVSRRRPWQCLGASTTLASVSSQRDSSPAPDPLGVRASTAAVMTGARHVRIVPEAAAAVAHRWANQRVTPPAWQSERHFFDGTHRSANWLLALDAVNFSFWSEDPAERWEVEYRGERLDGYRALAAALTRAVEEGTRVWDARTLADLTQGDVYRIFRGKGLIPLIADRLNSLREVGQVLLSKYRGQFVHAVRLAEGSAPRFVELLARDFSSFDDVVMYREREVRFYKRAQLLVSDLWGAFGGKSWGAFEDMETLTAFADYKLPQALREYGVLEYGPELAGRVDGRAIVPAGSLYEVEIRAATVQAVELLRDALAGEGVAMHPFQVDWLLWQQSQAMLMQHSYHLTRSIYY